MPRKLTGIRRWKGGWQAYVQVNGRPFAKSFPKSTPIQKLREWRDEKKQQFARVAPAAGSFAADVAEYLSRVMAMPTYKQRAAHLALWLDALGRDRPRASITSTDIDRVLNAWLTTPTNQPDPDIHGRRGRPSAPSGLEPGTVRKRRTALLSLFVKLDGKTASNPVRGSLHPQEPGPEVRGTDYRTLARALAAMPDYRSTKLGQPKIVNLSKVRATVMAYTGLPPATLKQVDRADINLSARTVRLHRRLKGKGTEARTIQLSAPAVDAFRAFIAANAFGGFAEGAVNVAFKRACRTIGVTGLHLYDLRHSFGAELYRQTGDLPTVGRALGHAPGSTVTQRYTKAAHHEVDAAAAAKMGAAIIAGRNLTLKPVPPRKARTRKQLRNAS